MDFRNIDFSGSVFLSSFIDAVYEMSAAEDYYYYAIPNGRIGLTFIPQGKAWYLEGDQWEPVPEASVFGLVKKTALIRLEKNSTDLSIGFNPVFMSAFLPVPLNELAGRFTPLSELFEHDSLNRLMDVLRQPTSDSVRLPALEDFLRSNLVHTPDEQLAQAYGQIKSLEINRVNKIAEGVNLSQRTLLNRFNRQVGLTPKELMKISRVNWSLNLERRQSENLTDLAYRLGYYDQAHFIHDFRETMSIQPLKYFNNRELISDFYNFDRFALRSFVP